MKAILVPSGDQLASDSKIGGAVFVRFVWSLPSAFMTKISLDMPNVPSGWRSKASLVPFGDQAGSKSLSLLRRRRSLPSCRSRSMHRSCWHHCVAHFCRCCGPGRLPNRIAAAPSRALGSPKGQAASGSNRVARVAMWADITAPRLRNEAGSKGCLCSALVIGQRFLAVPLLPASWESGTSSRHRTPSLANARSTLPPSSWGRRPRMTSIP